MYGPVERIEHEAKVLERHDAEQRLGIIGFTKYHRRVAGPLREREMALGHRARDRCPISQRESLFPIGRESDAPPHGIREQRVHRARIDEELNALRSRWPSNCAFDVSNAHLRSLLPRNVS